MNLKQDTPYGTTSGSVVNIPISRSANVTKMIATTPRKHMFAKPVTHTERYARAGFPAPRFCPTSVAAALLMPHDGSIAKMMIRSAIV